MMRDKILHALAASALLFSTHVMAQEVVEVGIQDFKFNPAELTIHQGDTVRWTNGEKRQYHSVWFEALGEPEPVDYLFPEDSYERTFPDKGDYPYRCGPHPEMTGVIHVR